MGKHVITQVGPGQWEYGDWTLTQELCSSEMGVCDCDSPVWVAVPPYEMDETSWANFLRTMHWDKAYSTKIRAIRHVENIRNVGWWPLSIEETIDKADHDIETMNREAWAEALAPRREAGL